MFDDWPLTREGVHRHSKVVVTPDSMYLIATNPSVMFIDVSEVMRAEGRPEMIRKSDLVHLVHSSLLSQELLAE